MPFTVSHAAAVFVFRRCRLIWSAFIVGSMAPDFPYIVASTEYRQIGHHFPGVLLFTVPTALFALWFFHAVIKRPIAGLLPASMQAKLQPQLGNFAFAGAARFAAILFSIALGIATHVLWDSFTHPFTWIWWHVPWLQQWVKVPLFGITPMFEILQYLSSFFGLLVLVIWCWHWCVTTPATVASEPPADSELSLALLMFVVAGVAAFLRAYLLVGRPTSREGADTFLMFFGVTALAIAFWELLIYCALTTSLERWSGSHS